MEPNLDSFPTEADDLTGDGLLLKAIVVEGDGEEAGKGAKVSVKYSLRLSHDQATAPFDTSEKRRDGTLTFTLGRKKVIPALELVAQSMKLGERCIVKSSARYAFGTKGLKRKGVPPDCIIFMEVEMVHFEGGEKKKSLSEMTPYERFEEAKLYKTAGNTFFKELKYEKAMSQYSQCIQYLSNVFYKPKSSPSDLPSKTVLEDDKEGSSKQNEDVTVGKEEISPDSADNVADEARKPPNEEGFEEAEVTDIDPNDENGGLQPKEENKGDEEEEVIETLDLSTPQTFSGQDEPSVRTESSPTEAQVEVEDIKNEEIVEDLQMPDPEESEVVSLHVTTLNNLSLCLVKLENYKQAVESASLALKMDTESSKALYYR